MEINIVKCVFIYLAIVSVIGFLMMGLDKWKAKRKVWRIPEKRFFLVSLLGGSIGVWLGMYLFHHKTKHWHFTVGIPLLLALQVMAVGYWLGTR